MKNYLFIDVLNIIQADERGRVVERQEVPLFQNDAFREAVINAFVHNLWKAFHNRWAMELMMISFQANSGYSGVV